MAFYRYFRHGHGVGFAFLRVLYASLFVWCIISNSFPNLFVF